MFNQVGDPLFHPQDFSGGTINLKAFVMVGKGELDNPLVGSYVDPVDFRRKRRRY